MDDVLPHTTLRYRMDSSECAGGAAVEKAVKQVVLPEDGYGKVVAVVGATCSGASMAASDLLEIFKTPIISASSTSPALSDSDAYPYFMRTVPSDLAQGQALGYLAAQLGATRMGVLSGDGAYPMGISREFRNSAQNTHGIQVPTTAFETISKQTNVAEDGKEYVNADLTLMCKVESLHNEGMKHFLFSLHDPDVHYLATTMFQTGFLRGEDFMYYGVDSWATTILIYLEGDTNVRGWWYNSDNLGGYWAIQGDAEWSGLSGGRPAKVVPLEHIGNNLQSITRGGGCKPVSGTATGDNVVLDGRAGTVSVPSAGALRITWADGEVWDRLQPPNLEQLQAEFQGSLALIAETSGSQLQGYIDDIWKSMPSKYDYISRNVYQDIYDDEDPLGWADTDGDRSTVHPYGPTHFDAAVTVALALDAVIKEGGDVNDGELLHQKMLGVTFEGLSGTVKYLANGDRDGNQYTILNLGTPGGGAPKKVGSITLGQEVPLSYISGAPMTYRTATATSFPGDGSCPLNSAGLPCSGRGVCDFGPGTCSCEAGFTGDSCQQVITAVDEGGMDENTRNILIGVCAPLAALLLGYFLYKKFLSFSATAHIFISYKHADKEQAEQVCSALQKQGNRVWIDTQITPGEDWKGEIAGAIKESLCVIFLASKGSLESRYCREEILFASSISKPVFTLLLEDCVRDIKGGVKMVLMRKQFVDIQGSKIVDGMEKCCDFIKAIRLGKANKVDMGRGRKQSLTASGMSVGGKSKKNIVFVSGTTVEDVEDETEQSDIVIVPGQGDGDIAQAIQKQLSQVGCKVVVTARESHVEGDEDVEVDSDMYARNAALVKKTNMILFLETPESMKSSECNDEIFFAYEQARPIFRLQIAQEKEIIHLSGSMAMMLTVSKLHRVSRDGLLGKGDEMPGALRQTLAHLHAIELAQEEKSKTDPLSALQKFQQSQVAAARGRRISNAIVPAGFLGAGPQFSQAPSQGSSLAQTAIPEV